MENGAYVTRSQLIGAERRAPAGMYCMGKRVVVLQSAALTRTSGPKRGSPQALPNQPSLLTMW